MFVCLCVCCCLYICPSVSTNAFVHVPVSAVIVSQWAILVLWLREALFGDSVD